MPRTAEHRADVHRLARARQDAGLPVWDKRISFAGLFHNDNLSFEQFRDAVVRKLRASAWLKGADEYSEIAEAVEELSETTDAAEFNSVWSVIYDAADYDRVWITTR